MRVFALVTGLAVAATLGIAQTPDRSGSQSGKNAASSSAQSQSKESTSSEKTNSESASNVKTQTYKGTLVDASCAGGGAVTSSSPAAPRNQASADRSSSDKSANKSAETAAKGEASRGGESANSCTPSTSTNEFALRIKDGQTLRFDAVGNERAKLEMTNNKKWKDASAASKAIQSTVSGTESGDTLMVLSIR